MAITLEMGPRLHSFASEFMLMNHNSQFLMLNSLMGERGLFLGFTGNIWDPASVRRIIWMQRHYPEFKKQGVNMALLVSDHPQKLLGYAMSSLTPVEFPLLADWDQAVHAQYHMEHYAGMVLVDCMWVIREKWIMPDERVWPHITDLMDTLKTL